MTSALFSPIALRGGTLPNRTVVSPMCQYGATDGLVSDWHLMHYGTLAVSGWGMVIVEATGVEPGGRISPGCLGLWSDQQVPGLARLVSFCKAHGQAAIALQLGHAGRKASVTPPWDGGGPASRAQGGWPVEGPSPIPFDQGWPVPEALDGRGLERIRTAFVGAAHRADRAGIDVLELHMAHGYLMNQFLSPLSNRREDQYGGSLANRMRFPLETFRAVRAAWPEDKPLGVRISASDWVEGGWTIDDSTILVQSLIEVGCDFVDVSSGGLVPNAAIPLKAGYQVPFAAHLRRLCGVPIITVGLIAKPERAERIVAEGQADMVALARGALDDPRWPWRAARALGAAADYPRPYLRCAPGKWDGEPAEG